MVNDSDQEKLRNLLNKVYSVESYLEATESWEASLSSQRFKNDLLKISDDSFNHRDKIIELSSRLGLELEKNFPETEPMIEENIFVRLMNREKEAIYLYEELLGTDQDVIKKHWENGDFNNFYSLIKRIIKQEKDHVDLIREMIRKRKLYKNELDLEKTSIKEAIDKIKKAEERLKETTKFGVSEILLLSFSDKDDFNEVLRKLNKKNVKINEVSTFPDEVVVEVEVKSPTSNLV